jgi:excisionase family DNA binding protein
LTQGDREMVATVPSKRWLSIPEAAAYLSVVAYTIRSAIWSGELLYIRAGKRIIVDRTDLDRWFESRKQLEGAFR